MYLGATMDDSRVHQIEQQIKDVEKSIKEFDKPLADLSQQEKKLRRDDETIRQEKVCNIKCVSVYSLPIMYVYEVLELLSSLP